MLATVYETAGSTYSKAGHRILLAANGDYRGLVSGGCLEGDLAERSRSVIATDTATAVTYDLRDSADELWGLGVGCNGLLRVFLQPLLATNDYQPFGALAECLAGTRRAGVATVIESERRMSPSERPPSPTTPVLRVWRRRRGHAAVAGRWPCRVAEPCRSFGDRARVQDSLQQYATDDGQRHGRCRRSSARRAITHRRRP